MIQGINPLYFGKTGEISICGSDCAAMPKGKRRKMCVRNQVGDGLAFGEHLLECNPMLLCGPDNSCTWLIKPALYAGKGLFKGERTIEHPRICPNPYECRQDSPAQAYGAATGKLIIPPLTCLQM